MSPTLFLIDGHAQLFRAFHAMEGLKAPDGTPTGAVYGFARMLMELERKKKPDAWIAVFDSPGPTFRHEAYPAYKANRPPPPSDLVTQIPLVQELVGHFGLPLFARPGWEADDILGTLARKAEAEGYDVTIVTGDKDCGQLITDRVRLYDPAKDKTTDLAAFREERGVEPGQLPDLMGLWGDVSDHIPGVPGIGQKLGAQFIAHYGSLESLLERAHEIKGKRGDELRAHRDQARLSKRLATIRIDMPLDADWPSARRRPPDTEGLRRLYERLGFKSFLRDLPTAAALAAPMAETPPGPKEAPERDSGGLTAEGRLF